MKAFSLVCLLLAGAAVAAPARLPIKEVTVFKDGHAFVLREGTMPTDSTGNVLLDDLPVPVLGTFWTWSNLPKAPLASVTAGQRRVTAPRTALSVRELIEANPGAEVEITEAGGPKYSARIIGVPERQPDDPEGSAARLPEKGSIVLLKTDAGELALPLDRIQSVAFKGAHEPAVPIDELRARLTLRLNWPGRSDREAPIGMVYVQKGLRWIPSYKVDVDGAGNAHVLFQATLVNELTDLTDTTANLVIGVPSFAMAGQVDPMALQQAASQLGQYFDRDSRFNSMSNSVMSQMAGFGGAAYAYTEDNGAAGPAPEVGSAGSQEDLFLFTVNHVTLRKGERMVLPIAEYHLKYRDVYTVEVPFVPPIEARTNYGSFSQEQLARLSAAPKAEHQLRITNGKQHPLTTAPALITSGGRVLGQGLITYTPIGGEVDLPVTTAVDVSVRKSEKETGRVPNAASWNGDQYGRVDLAGVLNLVNHKDKAVDLEVTRYVIGVPDTADNKGAAEAVNVLEDRNAIPAQGNWFYSYNWPYWWHHFNGIGRFTWKFPLKPGQSIDLNYTWHYFWR